MCAFCLKGNKKSCVQCFICSLVQFVQVIKRTQFKSKDISFPDDPKNRRHRRRFFPADVFTCLNSSSNEDKSNNSDMTYTAYSVPQPSSVATAIPAAVATTVSAVVTPSTVAANTTTRSSPRKSELSIHMENARKGVVPSYSEIGKYRCFPRRTKDKTLRTSISDGEHNASISDRELKTANKENIKHRIDPIKPASTKSSDDDKTDKYLRNSNISKRMRDLAALTHDTLARVEKLSNRNRDSPKHDSDKTISHKTRNERADPSDEAAAKHTVERPHVVISEPSKPHTFSILKKKEEVEAPNVPSTPVSILKRKISQDECKGAASHTPPVTFSPSVVEHVSSVKRQGILKKRRSLDESQVLRHRSCSPDVAAGGKADARSILKNQRRSSLEELTRTRSPDFHLQGILKRKVSKGEDDPENSLNSPQGILKRRSGNSSAGSAVGSQHVSIATAVILAAAGGAEMVLEQNDHVKPILKKKGSEEHPASDGNPPGEVLRPILKKKSSTDTDEPDDKPKKPILKMSRSSVEHSDHVRYVSNDSSSDCDVRPILKQNVSGTDEVSKQRLSFSNSIDVQNELENGFRHSRHRRSHTLGSGYITETFGASHEEVNGDFLRPTPVSVSELVMSFEKTTVTSTGAIPKRSSLKRNSDRSRTQPVTFNEIEAR